MLLLGRLMKISWNVDRVYIFCALQYKYEELLNYTCLDIPESDVESIDVLLKNYRHTRCRANVSATYRFGELPSSEIFQESKFALK